MNLIIETLNLSGSGGQVDSGLASLYNLHNKIYLHIREE